MKLVIVESPAKAKTIEKYLGKGFTVRASVGHIRDLPKSNKDAVDVENGFKPRYQIVKEKEEVIEKLHDAAKGATEVILATDPDREGEAIAWHLSEAMKLKKPKLPSFVLITPTQIWWDILVYGKQRSRQLKQLINALNVLLLLHYTIITRFF